MTSFVSNEISCDWLPGREKRMAGVRPVFLSLTAARVPSPSRLIAVIFS